MTNNLAYLPYKIPGALSEFTLPLLQYYDKSSSLKHCFKGVLSHFLCFCFFSPLEYVFGIGSALVFLLCFHFQQPPMLRGRMSHDFKRAQVHTSEAYRVGGHKLGVLVKCGASKAAFKYLDDLDDKPGSLKNRTFIIDSSRRGVQK